MAEIFKEAIKLLATFDKEIYEIVFLSMIVSFSSTFISTIIAVPLGILLGNIEFPFKRVVVRILYTTMSLPPVIVGLVVFLILLSLIHI